MKIRSRRMFRKRSVRGRRYGFLHRRRRNGI